jgi:hypothetical protein
VQALQVEQVEGEAGAHGIAPDARGIGLEGFEPAQGARHGGIEIVEGGAVARDDDIDTEAADHFQRAARGRQRVLAAHDLAEDDAEAVLPQRVARDQDALLGAVVDQRFHVVAGGGQRPPAHAAHFEFAAGFDHRVVGEALAALLRGVEQHGVGIPLGDHALDAGGDHDAAAEGGLQRGVAADVVGMRVGVDQAAEGGRSAPCRQRRLYECDGLRRMADIAGIDQRRRLALEEQDVVRRQPAALDDLYRVGQLHRSRRAAPLSGWLRRCATASRISRFSSSPILDQRAISSMVRKQPAHSPASILQTSMQGDLTTELSCPCGAPRAFRRRPRPCGGFAGRGWRAPRATPAGA